jgi:nitroimidazol reductase NimA-like FMN-containing flavoprotein (pyridoxamine 5'-phosphate oxidase superfamily)
MFGKLETNEIDKLLDSQLVGRIGCSSDGMTYVVPVSYVYDGTYIYVHSRPGMKLDIMRKNPEVCFQADNTKNLANWQSVICWGRFEELTTPVDKKEAFEKLSNRVLPVVNSETMRISAEWPFPGNYNESPGTFFRIKLAEKTGRFEKTTDAFFFAT